MSKRKKKSSRHNQSAAVLFAFGTPFGLRGRHSTARFTTCSGSAASGTTSTAIIGAALASRTCSILRSRLASRRPVPFFMLTSLRERELFVCRIPDSCARRTRREARNIRHYETWIDIASEETTCDALSCEVKIEFGTI
jgi:hypothetical protein